MAFMVSINEVRLMGNLGRDPELFYTANGKSVCNISLATNEVWKNQDGKRESHTEWHKVVVWGAIAEACAKHARKGSKLYVAGKIRTRMWKDQEGRDRFEKEIVGLNVIIDYEGSREHTQTPETEG